MAAELLGGRRIAPCSDKGEFSLHDYLLCAACTLRLTALLAVHRRDEERAG